MGQGIRGVVLGLLTVLLLAGCGTNPVTGRSQLIMMGEQEEQQMGLQAFRDTLSQKTVSRDPAQNAQVQRIGKRIALASGRSDYQWEFRVIRDKEINAFCLPGGKVAVHTGLLDFVQSDDELAAVVGHEVAHAIARHGAERMSQNMAAEVGVAVLGAVISAKSSTGGAVAAGLLGAGATYGVLMPFSRLHESEADHMGLIYMAAAGYDPNAAVTLWSRMAEKNKGKKLPEFFSTHPSDETRVKEIQAEIPEAMRYFRPISAGDPIPVKPNPVPASAPANAEPAPPAAALEKQVRRTAAAPVDDDADDGDDDDDDDDDG
ncbi:M48 family metallopeptidase [Azospirillum sp. sgz301742]